MSDKPLIKNNEATGLNRAVGTTKKRVEDNQREKRNERDREIYKDGKRLWKGQKENIELMDDKELHTFVKNGYEENILDDDRIGMITMKVNQWEYAVLTLTRRIMNYKSTRQAVNKLCIARINLWTGKKK